jgi:hypothetical protein
VNADVKDNRGIVCFSLDKKEKEKEKIDYSPARNSIAL